MLNEDGRSTAGWVTPLTGALVCLGLGVASGLSTMGGVDTWYQDLNKPPGTPPGWMFGPVWSVLYLMMGWAAGRLVRRHAWSAVGLFLIQFAFNLAWTPVFFGAQRIGIALFVIAALWLGLVGTLVLARRKDAMAAILLVPYALWVTYAAYLNAGILVLNQ